MRKDSRVHWLLWHLPVEFKGVYTLKFDYLQHSYTFYRKRDRMNVLDVFIVVRTSKHCFRVSYSNFETLEMQSFTVPKSKHAARRMWYIYKLQPP